MCFLKNGNFLLKKRHFLAQNAKKSGLCSPKKLRDPQTIVCREVVLLPDYKVERPYKINGVQVLMMAT